MGGKFVVHFNKTSKPTHHNGTESEKMGKWVIKGNIKGTILAVTFIRPTYEIGS